MPLGNRAGGNLPCHADRSRVAASLWSSENRRDLSALAGGAQDRGHFEPAAVHDGQDCQRRAARRSPIPPAGRELRRRHAMKTQVEFRSHKFPPYEGEQEQINPGLWGRRLAEYLVTKLQERGIETEAMVAEDWGWYIPVRNAEFRLALCCGHQDGADDEFLCFTEPSQPVVKRWFKKIDATAQLTRLTEALQQILASDLEIREIVWTEPR